MDTKRLYQFINNSFLAPLLADQNISDISYNGKDIYYLHRLKGRQKAQIKCSPEDIYDFLRHIANLSEVQWNVRDPFLDVSVGPLRINAVFNSIGRYQYQKTPTFALRVAPPKIIDYESDPNMPRPLLRLLHLLIKLERSIVIAGATSSGKTELQKYLLSSLPPATRVIVIDNLQELESVRSDHLDISLWQVQSSEEGSYISLIRNALRANPDWLIMAEARGGEMLDGLNCAMSGHPLIITLHSLDIKVVSTRMTRMVLMANKNLDYQIVYEDVIHHFPIIIYLKKKLDQAGMVQRYISDVGIYIEQDLHLLYQCKEEPQYFSLAKPLQQQLSKLDAQFINDWEKL